MTKTPDNNAMHTKRRWCAVSTWLDHSRRSVIADAMSLKRNRMQFRTSHLFLLTAVVALALVFRAVSIETTNDSLVSLSAICISVLITATMTLLGDGRRIAAIACGAFGAFAILLSHLAECWMETAATEYVWHGPQYRHYPLYVISCIAVQFGCTIIACVVSFLVSSLVRSSNSNA